MITCVDHADIYRICTGRSQRKNLLNLFVRFLWRTCEGWDFNPNLPANYSLSLKHVKYGIRTRIPKNERILKGITQVGQISDILVGTVVPNRRDTLDSAKLGQNSWKRRIRGFDSDIDGPNKYFAKDYLLPLILLPVFLPITKTNGIGCKALKICNG